jgi:hypothetical protein
VARRYRLSVRPTHRPVVLYYRHKPKIRASSTTYVRQPPKPPHGVANDGNFAHLYSGNILYDPGVELFAGNAVGDYAAEPNVLRKNEATGRYEPALRNWQETIGVGPYVLPRFDPTADVGQVWPSGEDVSYWDIAQWMQLGGLYNVDGTPNDPCWVVTRVDSYLGDHCMAWFQWTSDETYNVPAPLVVQAPGLPGGYSARVIVGDRITWSVYHKQIGTPPGWAWAITLFLYFYQQSGNSILATQTRTSLTGNQLTWTERTLSSFAPPGSYFVRAGVGFEGSPGRQATPMVDSGTLSIE